MTEEKKASTLSEQFDKVFKEDIECLKKDKKGRGLETPLFWFDDDTDKTEVRV